MFKIITSTEPIIEIPYAYLIDNDKIAIGPPGFLSIVPISSINAESKALDALIELSNAGEMSFEFIDSDPTIPPIVNSMFAIQVFAHKFRSGCLVRMVENIGVQPGGCVPRDAKTKNNSRNISMPAHHRAILGANDVLTSIYTDAKIITLPIPTAPTGSGVARSGENLRVLYHLLQALSEIHHSGSIHNMLSVGLINGHIDTTYAKHNLSAGMEALYSDIYLIGVYIVDKYATGSGVIDKCLKKLDFMQLFRIASLIDIIFILEAFKQEEFLKTADIPNIVKKICKGETREYPILDILEKFEKLYK